MNMQDSTTDIGFDPQGHSIPGVRSLTAMSIKVLRNYLIADTSHWLTGDNIDNIGDILNLSSPGPQQLGSYLFVNTRLMQQLYHDNRYTYSSVKNWGRARKNKLGINIFHYDTLYIPFNFTGMHWTGVIVKTKEKKLIYKDSMNDMNNHKHSSKGRTELQILKKYLTDDIQRRTGQTGREGITRDEAIRLGKPMEWETIRNTRTNMIQENDSDCGICYLANMLYDTQQRPTSVHISHIPMIRKQLFILLLSFNMLPYHHPTNIHEGRTDSSDEQRSRQTGNVREEGNRDTWGGEHREQRMEGFGIQGGEQTILKTHDNTNSTYCMPHYSHTTHAHACSPKIKQHNDTCLGTPHTHLRTIHANHPMLTSCTQDTTRTISNNGWVHPRGGIG